MKRKLVIIGCTGTIGKNAINVVKKNKNLFEVEALIANSSYLELSKQAKDIKPKYVFLKEEKYYDNLKEELKDDAINIGASLKDILSFLKETSKADVFLIGSSSSESIYYFKECLKTNKIIAIANKESIVCLGELFKEEISMSKAKVIPVDSEHNALFQILQNNNKDVSKIILTASGGPFLNYSEKDLKNVTKEEAIKHPNWNMGMKISVDSATFVNKALEVIEGHYLFNIPVDKIDVLIHPQSIIHAAVSYKDGSFIAHMSYPSMEIPIAYALNYPNRCLTTIEELSLEKISNLKFQPMNEFQTKIINLAKYSVIKGGNYPMSFNILNEVLVYYFLLGKLKFIDIIDLLNYVFDIIEYKKLENIDDVILEYHHIKTLTENFIKKKL